jgi:hypothetical protein
MKSALLALPNSIALVEHRHPLEPALRVIIVQSQPALRINSHAPLVLIQLQNKTRGSRIA